MRGKSRANVSPQPPRPSGSRPVFFAPAERVGMSAARNTHPGGGRRPAFERGRVAPGGIAQTLMVQFVDLPRAVEPAGSSRIFANRKWCRWIFATRLSSPDRARHVIGIDAGFEVTVLTWFNCWESNARRCYGLG
jgi:hypothetical protein